MSIIKVQRYNTVAGVKLRDGDTVIIQYEKVTEYDDNSNVSRIGIDKRVTLAKYRRNKYQTFVLPYVYSGAWADSDILEDSDLVVTAKHFFC